MTQYWVKFQWDVTQANVVNEKADNTQSLTFLGIDLGGYVPGYVPGVNSITFEGSPPEATTNGTPVTGPGGSEPESQLFWSNLWLYGLATYGTVNGAYQTVADNTIIQNVSIGNYYEVGSQPDPTTLYGPLASETIQGNQLIGGTLTADSYTMYYYQYEWAIVDISAPSTLFTTGADVVDFNDLTSDQQSAIAAGADIYDGLGGNDVVTLPDAANFSEIVEGHLLNWSSTTPFQTGSLADQTYTVNGSDGNYDIDLGAGSDTVTIIGDGSSTIAGGSGTGNIFINGNGANNITIGAGTDNVTVKGTGANTISAGTSPAGITITNFAGSLTGFAPSPSTGATIKLTGTDNGNASIGSNSTLELAINSSLNGTVTFGSTTGGTLKIDGTAMPTAVVKGFAAYVPPSPGYPGIAPYTGTDTIDLAGVLYDPNKGIASLLPNNVLQVRENNESYTLQLDPSATFEGDAFELSNDGYGFTDIQVIKKNPNAGFDIATYNSNLVSWLWANTNLSWIGYYLTAPHHTDSSYMGTYQSLAKQGWKIAPIYIGAQDIYNNPGPSADQGKKDGNAAAQLMDTQIDVFQKAAAVPIFLDIEPAAPPSVNEQAYITNWCTTVRADGYIPGIYYNSSNDDTVEAIHGAAPAGTIFWEASYGSNNTASPGLTIIPTPDPSGSNDPEAIAWQYQGGNGAATYSIGPAQAPNGVDLDSFTTTSLLAYTAPSDFNGDGKSSVVWQNTNGDVELWLSNSGSESFTGDDLGVVGDDWQIAATGDFSEAGEASILWRNTNGDTALWNANGSGGFAFQDLGVVGVSWQVAGTGDFNGAGEGILWRNTNGDTALWNANGSGGFAFQDLGVVGTGWQIAGTGVFNATGEDSILWRNSNGDTALWNPNGSGGFAFQDLGVVGTGWQIAGTGDFSGTGKDSILWRNSNGDTVLWNPNGSGGFAFEDLGVVGTSWQIAGTGDFNGAGEGILWRSSNGDTALWNANGSGGFAFEDLGVVGTSWSVHKIFA
jgi:hypothetical protein